MTEQGVKAKAEEMALRMLDNAEGAAQWGLLEPIREDFVRNIAAGLTPLLEENAALRDLGIAALNAHEAEARTLRDRLREAVAARLKAEEERDRLRETLRSRQFELMHYREHGYNLVDCTAAWCQALVAALCGPPA